MHKIAIIGGNGSGKTTLGKHLAELLGCKHIDVEDYYFTDSDIPYSVSRSEAEVRELILADIRKYHQFILTSVNGDMGPEINALYDCIFYLQAPLDIRIDRVKKRTFDKFGDRVLEGGDMYEQERAFFDFVANRTLDAVDAWVETMKCPVFYLDGCTAVEDNADLIKEYLIRRELCEAEHVLR